MMCSQYDLLAASGTVMLPPGDDDSDDSRHTDSTTPAQIIGPDGKSLIDIDGGHTAIVYPQAPEETSAAAAAAATQHSYRRTPGRKPNLQQQPSPMSSVDVLLPYKCNVCEYRARWPSEITQHKKNHSDEKPYRCPRCTYKSKWKWDVVKHLKRCGGGSVKDVIVDPGHDNYDMRARSYSPENLAPANRRELSGGPPNVTVMPTSKDSSSTASSSTDQYQYENKTAELNDDDDDDVDGGDDVMMADVQQQTTASLQCKECSFLATNLHELRTHHSKFHSKYDAQHVYCSHCPFVGKNPAELKRHLRVHSDEKPFVCRTCNYSSKWKCDLKKHCESKGHEPVMPLNFGGQGRRKVPDELEASLSDEQNASSECDSADTEENVPANEMPEDSADDACHQFVCTHCDHVSENFDSFLQHKLTHGSDDIQSADDNYQLSRSSEPSGNRRKQSKQSIMKNQSRMGFGDGGNLPMFPGFESEKVAASSNDQPYKGDSLLHEHSFTVGAASPSSYSSPSNSPALSPVTGKAIGSKGKKTKRRLKFCDRCDYTTDNFTTLKRHQAMHGKQGKYACTRCDYSVNKQHIIGYHMRMVHASQANGSTGESTVTSQVDVDNNSNGVGDDAASVSRSTGFGNGLRSSRLEEDIVKIVHIGNRTVYGCTKCSYNTTEVSSILEHTSHHAANMQHSCMSCDYSTDDHDELERHQHDAHDDVTVSARASATDAYSFPSSPQPADDTEPRPNRVRHVAGRQDEESRGDIKDDDDDADVSDSNQNVLVNGQFKTVL